MQNNNPIRVEYGVDSVRDCDDGAVLEHVTSQGCLQHSIGLDVNCGGRFVKNCQRFISNTAAMSIRQRD